MCNIYVKTQNLNFVEDTAVDSFVQVLLQLLCNMKTDTNAAVSQLFNGNLAFECKIPSCSEKV